MAVMDYSQQQRVIDGTGRILDTTMTNPNTGSYVTETQLKTWINTGMATDADLAAEVAQREADISDLKNALTAVDHRVQNLESAKGDYVVQNYKDGSITPSGKGNWAIVEGLRGVSRVENQLFKTSASRTIGGVTCTNVDGTLTLSGVSTSSYAEIFDNMQIVANHSYLVYFADVVNPNNLSFNVGSLNTIVKSYLGTPKVATPTNGLVSSGMGIESYASGTNFNGISFKFFIRDLNVYFGTMDLSFLGADDSAKLATIQKDYPHLLTPSEYGTRIVDSSYSGVRAVGVNIWDEEWEVGRIASSTGTNADTGYDIRSKDYIPVFPSTTYYFLVPPTGAIFFYDYSKNYISTTGPINSGVFSTPSNCVFIRFCTYSGSGYTTYNHDITIAKGSTAVDYHPYHAPSTLSLTFQGKSAGSVYDSCEPNVEVEGVARRRDTQRIASVDMGTLNYTMTTISGHKRFMSPLAGFPIVTTENLTSLLCARYIAKGEIAQGYMWGNGGNIYIVDDNYSDADSFKASLSGVMLNYELADPVVTLSDPLIDNTLLTEAGGRLSTVQTGTVVDGSFDMGFINL